MADILTLTELNRATLARQSLLERRAVPVVEAVEQALALQAQEAKPPFVGLWSRVDSLDAKEVHDALHQGDIVRATHLRATLHLLSARDYTAFRTPVQPLLSASADAIAKRLGGPRPEPAELLAAARTVLADGPAEFGTIRERLQESFPDVNDRLLGYAVRMELPLVMAPTDDPWAFPSSPRFTLAESWLGSPPHEANDPGPLLLRYLAAFGPASVADAEKWSGMTKLKAVFEELRPRLRVFGDEAGRELFDLPDAPRPGAEVPAPARLLPEFDSLVLAHSDRTRIVSEEHRPRLVSKNLRVAPAFLWDGFVRGTWKTARSKTSATLHLQPFEPLPAKATDALVEEAGRLLEFTDPDVAKRDVRVEEPA